MQTIRQQPMNSKQVSKSVSNLYSVLTEKNFESAWCASNVRSRKNVSAGV